MADSIPTSPPYPWVPVVSIPDVCDVSFVGDPARLDAPDLLIELPHGATAPEDFERLAGCLNGPFPDELEAFFFVNTDVGSPECAADLATLLADPWAHGLIESPSAAADRARPSWDTRPRGWSTLILRSRIPRTFIDCNRVAAADATSPGMTPQLPFYVTDARDREVLGGLYREYQAVADSAYRRICGGGGLALMLHTYAPRSVDIGALDQEVVTKLRAAYEDYGRWPLRPDVDLITESVDGARLAPERLAEVVRAAYTDDAAQHAIAAAAGSAAAEPSLAPSDAPFQVGENATYRLFPETTGYLHAERYPGRTLVAEFRRDRLADPFDPFAPMRMGAAKVRSMCRPLAQALLGLRD